MYPLIHFFATMVHPVDHHMRGTVGEVNVVSPAGVNYAHVSLNSMAT